MASAPTSSRAASGRSRAAAGLPNERITLEGIGKTPADLRAAARAAADGRPAALGRPRVARGGRGAGPAVAAPGGPGSRLDVLYRLNPDVAPETLAGLAVGAGASKFGMTETELGAAIEAGGGPDGPLRPRGIHLHVGSQLGAVDAWRDAVRKALAVAALWRGSIERLRHARRGRWLPGPRRSASRPRRPNGSPASCPRCSMPSPRTVDRPASRSSLDGPSWRRAGWLVARVLHVRERGGRQVVLDAGMTELIRPALYGARHPIVALTSLGRDVAGRRPGSRPGRGTGTEPTRVEGPICESDRLARGPRPATPSPRRPRGHRRRGRLRRLARLRPTTAARDRRRCCAAPDGSPHARAAGAARSPASADSGALR